MRIPLSSWAFSSTVKSHAVAEDMEGTAGKVFVEMASLITIVGATIMDKSC